MRTQRGYEPTPRGQQIQSELADLLPRLETLLRGDAFDPATASGHPKDAPNRLVPVILEALRGSRVARTAVIDRAAASITPAMYLWNKGKIPTIGYISFNTYFLAEARNGHIDRLDPDQLYDQVRTLGRAIKTIDRTPLAQLRP